MRAKSMLMLLVCVVGSVAVAVADERENEAIVRRAVDEIWNKANLPAAEELLTADFARFGPVAQENTYDRAAFKEYVRHMRAVYPDFRVTINEIDVEFLLQHFIESLGEAKAGTHSVDRDVLVAVGDPDIGDARRSEFAAEALADSARHAAMVDPEPAHGVVGARQGEAAVGHRVREAGRIEIDASTRGLGPIGPAREMLGSQLVALDFAALGFGVDGVKVQTVRAGNQAVGHVQVLAQLVGRFVVKSSGLSNTTIDAGMALAQVLSQAMLESP